MLKDQEHVQFHNHVDKKQTVVTEAFTTFYSLFSLCVFIVFTFSLRVCVCSRR